MRTQDQIIESIVDILSKERQVCKVFFFINRIKGNHLLEATLIIYEDCEPDYIISQGSYEELLKDIANKIQLNILPVNSVDAEKFLDRRLEDLLCIYERKDQD
jgi:hypothetical protein